MDRPHERLDIGDMALESGETLHEAFVSYVIHGDAARIRDHAILVLSAIGSTHHRLDFLIGPGNALDTDSHCVVAVDALGNGLSVSPSNSTAQPGARFPRISISDMVESQRRLINQLGVNRLFAIVGASMGGMQALQWAVTEPRRMRRVVAITPMARTSRWSQLLNEMSRRALFSDAECRVVRAREDALRLWLPLTQLLMPRTPEAVEHAFDSREALLRWTDDPAAPGIMPDAFDWCRQSQAYDGHDVGHSAGMGGDTARALAAIDAEVLILSPAQDLYNPPFAARDAAAGIRLGRFVELPGVEGHRSASGVAEPSTAALRTAIQLFLQGEGDLSLLAAGF